MRLDDLPEIIEIIDEDSDAFGQRPQDHTTHDTGGHRWIGPIAAVTLAGLIGYGIVTSTTGAAPSATPATSTSLEIAIPKQFQPVSTTVPVPAPIPYYASDPPREFSVQFADSQQFVNDLGLVSYELWATPGASAATGSWFSVTSYHGAPPVYAGNSYRVQSGEMSIAMSHTAGGHALMQFTTASHLGVTIAAFGWSDDALIRLAGAVEADGTSFSDNWFTSDHQLISTVEPWLAMRGLPVEQVGYSTAEDSDPAFVITVSQPTVTGQRRDAERQVALQFLLDRNTAFIVDGHPAVAGSVIGEGTLNVANWIDGDVVITVAGELPVAQIIAIARTVHEITAPEWAGIKFQADRKPHSTTTTQTAAGTVSTGTDAALTPWIVAASLVSVSGSPQINWSWGTQNGATTPGNIAQINTVVEGQRTFVLADLPRAVADTGTLQILRDGLEPVMIPFVDIGADADRTFAAFAFSEPVPYTAQIVTADGSVVATWPTS